MFLVGLVLVFVLPSQWNVVGEGVRGLTPVGYLHYLRERDVA